MATTNNSNLNKIFVWVPSAKVATYKSTTGLGNEYKGKIAFLEGTGEIMTQGVVFATNKDADWDALKTLIGQSEGSYKTIDASINKSNIIDAINELKRLIDVNKTAIGDASSGLTQSVNTLKSEVETTTTGLLDRVTAAENAITTLNAGVDTAGSVDKKVSDAISNIVNNAPAAFDTLKEIADWIGTGDVASTTAATMLGDIDSLKTKVGNDRVTDTEHPENSTDPTGLYARIESVENELDSLSGGAGSISTQIDNKIGLLDSSVTLTGTTASQPANVTRSTSIDVLGSVTISETDGKIDAEAAGKSAKVVLQADAAGAAAQAYADLLGTNADTKDTVTLYGVKAYVDDAVSSKNVSATGESGTGALVTATATNNAVTVASTSKLQTAVGLAETALQSVTISSGDTNTLGVAANAASGNNGATITPKVGTLATGTTTSLSYDTTNGKLATVDNIASAINGITLWETVS